MSRAPAALLTLLLTGCACGPQERVVLLPDSDGKVGKIAVLHSNKETTLLDSAYGAAEVVDGKTQKVALDKGAVERAYGRELRALPPRPVSYTLYFLGNASEMTPESSAQVPVILKDIAQRPAAEVVVIGHTDRVGSVEDNDRLSQERAAAVRDQLVTLGFDAARLKHAGRGEREPVVPTEDSVAEPRNRRAEVNVR